MTSEPDRYSMDRLTCPACREIGTLRIVIYGMPDPEHFDFDQYAVGGCCISGEGLDPDVRCRECEWEGFRKDL